MEDRCTHRFGGPIPEASAKGAAQSARLRLEVSYGNVLDEICVCE